MKSPRVSIVIPVYNTQRYLTQCIDSILKQTEKNLEIVCVDDGSTDGSLEVLEQLAVQDSRLKVVRQNRRGAGSARNFGMNLVSGTYITFLDSDDFFEPRMLEDAANRLDETEADIVVFKTLLFNENEKCSRSASWTYVERNIPDKAVFTWHDMPSRIFNTFGNYTWNKLFRRSFVVENNLDFQEISRTNDLYFTCRALILARGITTINKDYVHYRVGTGKSLQSTNDRDPLMFFEAFKALQTYLMSRNLYTGELKRSFLNHALNGTVSNIESLKTLEGLTKLKEAVAGVIEPQFSFLKNDDIYFFDNRKLQAYKNFYKLDLQNYLVFRIRYLNDQKEKLLWKVEGYEKSKSFKLGRSITKPLRLLQNTIGKR